MRAGIASSGAISYPSARTVYECQQACEVRAECVAIDCDTGSSESFCWLHLDIAELPNTFYRFTVTQYRIVRCTSKSVH